MATKAKTAETTTPVWVAIMDYTGMYGPLEVVPQFKTINVMAGEIRMHLRETDRGLKWAGDGIEMSCAYIAATKHEVAIWMQGVKAVHKMLRSSMRKGK